MEYSASRERSEWDCIFINGEDEEGKWKLLLPELLQMIFEKVSLEERILCLPFICKSWQKASRSPGCWKSLDFRQLSRPEFSARFCRAYDIMNGRFSFSGLLKLLASFGEVAVQELVLRKADHITSDALAYALEKCPGVKIEWADEEEVEVNEVQLLNEDEDDYGGVDWGEDEDDVEEEDEVIEEEVVAEEEEEVEEEESEEEAEEEESEEEAEEEESEEVEEEESEEVEEEEGEEEVVVNHEEESEGLEDEDVEVPVNEDDNEVVNEDGEHHESNGTNVSYDDDNYDDEFDNDYDDYGDDDDNYDDNDDYE
ncbi:hypothetical protein H6P81_019780 [Aristolochia fimbriata]|uniref:F-box domain-containing protein n=1 Tax=Aristolochia fimbriata TaxID=158543 RepID=A0AAV7DUH8_ARIFI|nr:hypothetical protein H6P81_019780 [Aristolochia fimbriata]